jgi:hypothetical protein
MEEVIYDDLIKIICNHLVETDKCQEEECDDCINKCVNGLIDFIK